MAAYPRKNIGFVLVRPDASTRQVLELVKQHLCARGVFVRASGEVKMPTSAHQVDRLFPAAARNALHVRPEDMVVHSDVPLLWKYVGHPTKPLDLRSKPCLSSSRTGEKIRPNHLFKVEEVVEGDDGETSFMRLPEGRGWAFDRAPDPSGGESIVLCHSVESGVSFNPRVYVQSLEDEAVFSIHGAQGRGEMHGFRGADCNGRYEHTDDFNGSPKYTKVGGDAIVYFREGRWRVNREDDTAGECYCTPEGSEGRSPPEGQIQTTCFTEAFTDNEAKKMAHFPFLKYVEDTFKETFQDDWFGYKRYGRVYNAAQTCETFGFSPEELCARWMRAREDGNMVRLGRGFHCARIKVSSEKLEHSYLGTWSPSSDGEGGVVKIDGAAILRPIEFSDGSRLEIWPGTDCCTLHIPPGMKPIYGEVDENDGARLNWQNGAKWVRMNEEVDVLVVNGFYPAMRVRMAKRGGSAHYFIVEWDEEELSWSDFRDELIGASDPEKAGQSSLHALIADRWRELGLPDAPSILNPALSSSASAFEAMCDRIGWLGHSLANDPLASMIAQKGVSLRALRAWSRNPHTGWWWPGYGFTLSRYLFDFMYEQGTKACVSYSYNIHGLRPHLEGEVDEEPARQVFVRSLFGPSRVLAMAGALRTSRRPMRAVRVLGAEALRAAIDAHPTLRWDAGLARVALQRGEVLRHGEAEDARQVLFPEPLSLTVWLPESALVTTEHRRVIVAPIEVLKPAVESHQNIRWSENLRQWAGKVGQVISVDDSDNSCELRFPALTAWFPNEVLTGEGLETEGSMACKELGDDCEEEDRRFALEEEAPPKKKVLAKPQRGALEPPEKQLAAAGARGASAWGPFAGLRTW